jgi:hypothetical protein
MGLGRQALSPPTCCKHARWLPNKLLGLCGLVQWPNGWLVVLCENAESKRLLRLRNYG